MLISQLTEALAHRGHKITLFTSDYDYDKSFITSLNYMDIHVFHCSLALGNFLVALTWSEK